MFLEAPLSKRCEQMTEKPLTSVRCPKMSHSFAAKLAEWLQQQQQTADEYPDYDPEPGWDAYLDKEAELSSQLHALSNHPGWYCRRQQTALNSS